MKHIMETGLVVYQYFKCHTGKFATTLAEISNENIWLLVYPAYLLGFSFKVKVNRNEISQDVFSEQAPKWIEKIPCE